MLVPILLFAFVCIEIVLLIKLAQVGGGFVLAEILLSGVIGYLVLRLAGKTSVRADTLIELLLRPAANLRRPGWGLIFGAILLIIPGIMSDILGIVLILRHLLARPTRPSEAPTGPSDVIDVDFEVRDSDRT